MTPPLYMENDVHVPYQKLENFYSSRSFVDKLLQYWKESDNSRAKFSYLAMTAPHCAYFSFNGKLHFTYIFL
jgi:hypothetical protein